MSCVALAPYWATSFFLYSVALIGLALVGREDIGRACPQWKHQGTADEDEENKQETAQQAAQQECHRS